MIPGKALLKGLSNLLFTAILLLVLLFAVPNLLGIKMFAVLSGSMEPSYPVGSLVYAVPTEPDKIREGDVISFHISGGSVTATHRVVKADHEAGQFYTKGDANDSPDASPVLSKDVIGKVMLCIPWIGYLMFQLNTFPGKCILMGLVIIALLLSFLVPDKADKKKKQ